MRWIFFAFGSRLYRLPIDAISIQLTLGALSESTLVSFAKPIGIWKKFHDALVLSTYFVLFAPKSFTKFCWHVPSYAGFWLDIRCFGLIPPKWSIERLLVDFPRAPEQIFDYKPIGIWKKFHDALVLSTYFVLFAPKSFTKFCWHVPSYAGFWLDIRCLAWYLLNGVSNGLLVDFPRAPEQIFDYKNQSWGPVTSDYVKQASGFCAFLCSWRLCLNTSSWWFQWLFRLCLSPN